LKKEKDDYTKNIGKGYWDDIVNRNRLFYCTHMNRNNAFFQKHILNTGKKTGETPNQIAAKIYEAMFQFTRIRQVSKDNVMALILGLIAK
jgi:hypothetical protein